MAALTIQCFLDEIQMATLTTYVSKCLYRMPAGEIQDIDTCFDNMNVRLCVGFDSRLEGIDVQQAEVLDKYWNVIEADSAVLRARLRKVVDDYNYQTKAIG